MHYTIHTDGGARGNPGPAGAGVVIESEGKKIRFNQYLGERTNNQAEYEALIIALKYITQNFDEQNREVVTVFCFLDSELAVKQLNGEYKVKNPKIRILYEEVCRLSKQVHRVYFRHIPREENIEADQLVNKAIDEELKNA